MTILEARQLLGAMPNQLQACTLTMIPADDKVSRKLRTALGEVVELKDQYEKMADAVVEFGVEAELQKVYIHRAEALELVIRLIRDEMLRTEAISHGSDGATV